MSHPVIEADECIGCGICIDADSLFFHIRKCK